MKPDVQKKRSFAPNPPSNFYAISCVSSITYFVQVLLRLLKYTSMSLRVLGFKDCLDT